MFLHKYNEPVLLILHEVAPTWPARYRDSKDTMALTALSINVVHKRHPKIWDASVLPSDTFKLIPVPSGGALALSQNMIMYFTQVTDSCVRMLLLCRCSSCSLQLVACPALPCPASPLPGLALPYLALPSTPNLDPDLPLTLLHDQGILYLCCIPCAFSIQQKI